MRESQTLTKGNKKREEKKEEPIRNKGTKRKGYIKKKAIRE